MVVNYHQWLYGMQSLGPEQTIGEVPGTIFPKGWMDMELFKYWFLKHFLQYAPST